RVSPNQSLLSLPRPHHPLRGGLAPAIVSKTEAAHKHLLFDAARFRENRLRRVHCRRFSADASECQARFSFFAGSGGRVSLAGVGRGGEESPSATERGRWVW